MLHNNLILRMLIFSIVIFSLAINAPVNCDSLIGGNPPSSGGSSNSSDNSTNK